MPRYFVGRPKYPVPRPAGISGAQIPFLTSWGFLPGQGEHASPSFESLVHWVGPRRAGWSAPANSDYISLRNKELPVVNLGVLPIGKGFSVGEAHSCDQL